ncbi:MAG: chemotaxis-specific protein-glutamate methyltransferase CheB [Magnetococcales bacterium]|nr:chemotaxis-specific protein-glutamate methyltransferase CheB [Magnetococcales bacterium]
MARSLRVMVVDDTITYRMIMKKVAESVPGVRVTATASNGKLALDKIVSQFLSKDPECPDVVLLDVEMPVMDGLKTLKEINRQFPTVTVVMVSGSSRSNANIIMECLNAGALDFITKPMESNVDQARGALHKDLEPILTLLLKELVEREAKDPDVAQTGAGDKASSVAVPEKVEVRTGPLPRIRVPSGGPGRLPPPVGRGVPRNILPGDPLTVQPRGGGEVVSDDSPELILVGSSTGGPAALTRLLGRIGRRLPVPMLIVQHMPPVFTASLAAQLARTSGLDVKEAQDGQWVGAGEVVIAQGGRHMTVISEGKKLRVVLNDGPKVNECRPAVDVLFMSASVSFQGRILAVILTGMGRDGANGVDALKRSGHTYCITQDKTTCVVYGMPRSVDEKGLSDLSLPLDEIGPKIAGFFGSGDR